jgi:hypothetical protein
LGHLQADVIAFPDDDCTYPPDLLERVASTLSARPELDGILGRTEDSIGRSSANWASVRQRVTRNNVWHCSNSNSIFLGRDLLERLGSFDEALGLGSRWSSGEETELLVRAVDLGAELEYDPSLVVVHADRALSPDVGLRDGASVGYILGKHSYPRRAFARMTVRAVGGAAASLLRLDVERARFHAATFRGRVSGYRAGVKAGREGA